MEYTKSSRGADQLLYEGHKYNVNRKSPTGRIFWRCHNRSCPGRLSVLNDRVVSCTDHSHPPNDASNIADKMMGDLRQNCKDSVDTIPKLYNDMLLKVAERDDESVASQMPTFPSLKSSLYRTRQETIPKLPVTRDDIVVEEEWAHTLANNRFLLRSDGEGDQKMLIFASDKILERLSVASTLYTDGTFAVCPRLFYQLFTINIVIEDHQYPAVYALPPAKSRQMYNRLFTVLKEEMQNRQIDLLPPRVLTDFEVPLMQSIKLHFPTSTLAGCYFHFHQCLYRWVQTNGHSRLYNENGHFYNFVRSAAALAFVPVQLVRLAWFAMKTTNNDCVTTSSFIQYFSNTWMSSFPVPTWNHYISTDDRTNNSLEGWHNRLNRLAGRAHPNIWQLLRLLQKEEAVTEVKIVQMQIGGVPVPKRNTWVKLNRRIQRMKAKIEEIPLEDYISRMAHLTGL